MTNTSYLSKMTRLTRNVVMDLRYGSFLGGTVENRLEEKGGYITANSDYQVLPEIFQSIVQETDVLVDVGCGKGRVINWWLGQYPNNKLYGLELAMDVAERTANRLKKYRNVKILPGDAIQNLPEEATLFYLFNPFDEKILSRFKEKVLEFVATTPNLRIIYYNCLHLDVFQNDPNWRITEITLSDQYHRAAVITPTSASNTNA